MPTHIIFADYHQFYLFDEAACPAYPEDITEADLQQQLKAVPHLIAVYTQAEAELAITVESSELPPPLDHSIWAHIVQAPLNLPSGRVVLASPSSDLAHAQRISVPPGAYRAQVAASADGQRYLVSLWPSTVATVDVIKPSVQHAA